jgi:hypothetical protein
VEGYDSPVAGVTRSADKDDDDDDDAEDEDITKDGNSPTPAKKKKSSSSSSSKAITILSRNVSEFETCTPEKSVEFDPVQGTK